MSESVFDGIQSFERYPKLRDEMRNKGDSVVVSIADEGRFVDETVVKAALERKGYTNIKPGKSIVIIAEKDNGEKREIWHKATDFTALRQLKAIKDANGGNLTGASVRVTRIAVNIPNEPNWKYEIAH